jgi:protein-S-isoprenylcysteine O-methyltransferase Ste14
MRRLFRTLGLVAFAGSIGVLVWWWIDVGDAPQRAFSWQAAAADSLLFLAFASHHSILARQPVKRAIGRRLGDDLVRSTYVWVASALLLLVCLWWRPVGGGGYRAEGWAAAVLRAGQVAGLLLAVLAVRRISVAELAGLAPPRPTDDLQQGGPYRIVRHPLYLGWVLIVWGTTRMTGDRLLFAAASTIYLLAAMPLEEADLARQFGDRYRAYRRVVRWRLIPYIH